MNTASPVEALRSPQQSVAQPSNLLTLLQSPKVQDSLKKVTGKLLDPQRLLRLAIHSVKTTPKLAMCTPGSVLGSVMLSASFGLEPNTPSQQAFLIPYKRRRKVAGKWTDVYECQFQFGYRGMITLAYRSGIVTRLKAEAIREHDDFDYSEGSEHFLKYSKNLRERGELVGAFCHTELKGGTDAATVLPGDFIRKIRERSQTFRALRDAYHEAKTDQARAKAEAAYNETPWILWEDQMWAKTCIKAHTGQLPIFEVAHTILSSAAALDDASEAGVIDMDDFVDADAAIAAANGELNTNTEEEESPATAEDAGPPKIERDTTIPIDLGLDRGERAPAETHSAPAEQEKPPTRRQAPPRADAPATTSSLPEEPAGLFGPAE